MVFKYLRGICLNYLNKDSDLRDNEIKNVTPYSPKYESKIRYSIPALTATLCLGTILAAGDGSDEPGFVAPPKNREAPLAPPRTISSAETTDPCCCCPVTSLARTEAKKPLQPPTLITKLKTE